MGVVTEQQIKRKGPQEGMRPAVVLALTNIQEELQVANMKMEIFLLGVTKIKITKK